MLNPSRSSVGRTETIPANSDWVRYVQWDGFILAGWLPVSHFLLIGCTSMIQHFLPREHFLHRRPCDWSLSATSEPFSLSFSSNITIERQIRHRPLRVSLSDDNFSHHPLPAAGMCGVTELEDSWACVKSFSATLRCACDPLKYKMQFWLWPIVARFVGSAPLPKWNNAKLWLKPVQK